MGRALSAAVVMLTAGMALASGCAGPPDPSPASRPSAKPAITPDGEIVPPTGGGDVPEATLAVCRECQKLLASGQYQVAAERMERRSRIAHHQPSPGEGAGDSSATAVALVCAGAARASLGQYKRALKNLDAADQIRKSLPAETRPQLLELMYHAQLISYTATGEHDKVRETLALLAKLGKNPDRYLKEVCATAPAPELIPECVGSTPGSPTGSTVSPSGEKEPTTTPPSTSIEPAPSDTPSTDDETDDGDPEPEPGENDTDQPAPDES
ncbi:tetratricopeptide repeat protein [Nonomuraea dietziae]|uniref:tetratricopeptide repeat protein n=1 Tax=Nonomuraea dietziae TaxID=65515 RepID=UPI0033E8C27B